ncbi:MAG: hypothetical protein ACI4PR_05425 [Acutalibacteraceae bacterium]
MSNIILYSNGCPKCNVLKSKLESKKIQFKETNDFSKLEKIGVKSLPIMEIEGEILTFVEANTWINTQKQEV